MSDDGDKAADARDSAIEALNQRAGAPVNVEINEAGVSRVISTTPHFPITGFATDPVAAAKGFLAQHRDVFQLAAGEADSFVATRVDVDPTTDLRHITLQRTHEGVAVYQGSVVVHMDSRNNVYRVTGDEFYKIGTPTNIRMLSPTEAAQATGKALNIDLQLTQLSAAPDRTTFAAPKTLDDVVVSPKVFHVEDGDDRFAYQTTVSWLDEKHNQQYELVLVDAMDGTILHRHSLVNDFRGRVFTRSPGAPATDNRALVSMDGDPTASPLGWIDSTRRTKGNNATACTDLDRNNACGAAEIQPTPNLGDDFDFPYSPTTNASSFRELAVTNAFYLVNDYHDRTYNYGFTETAGNFQLSNRGLGGAQNDEVQVDAQDASGTNNANFATPPDGSRPRMQMFLFTINGGAQEDGDFDPGVIYHENSHGLSNRLVGGGSTGCLNGIQSGGMGEGWGDFLGASFINDPVVGAYVTGNATVGIRRASMAASPFTYANIKDGSMAEVHDAGEIWAAALWTVRNGNGTTGVGNLGAAVTERLVVQGMKNTPCNPTMLQARDGILTADVQLNGGANRCAIFRAFASRQMGDGASSPNHNSTSTIVLSSNVPADCGGMQPPTGTTRNFVSTDVPKNIPDNNATGVRSVLTAAPAGLDLLSVTVDVNITHTFRGDLVIQLIAPNGAVATLSNRAGGSADNFIVTNQAVTFPAGTPGSGTWQLFVRDLARIDTGRINSFVVHLTSTN